MKSRYDVMTASIEQNTRGLYYPDVLTFDMNKFTYNYALKEVIVTQRYKDRFYLACFSLYQTCDYDDIVLWLNNKESVHSLVIGETIYFPDIRDIESFMIDNKVSNN